MVRFGAFGPLTTANSRFSRKKRFVREHKGATRSKGGRSRRVTWGGGCESSSQRARRLVKAEEGARGGDRGATRGVSNHARHPSFGAKWSGRTGPETRCSARADRGVSGPQFRGPASAALSRSPMPRRGGAPSCPRARSSLGWATLWISDRFEPPSSRVPPATLLISCFSTFVQHFHGCSRRVRRGRVSGSSNLEFEISFRSKDFLANDVPTWLSFLCCHGLEFYGKSTG